MSDLLIDDSLAVVPDKVSADDLSERHAALIRGEWEDWKTNGKLYEDMQASLLLDPTKRDQLRGHSMGYVKKSVDLSHAAGLGSLQRRDERFGVALNPQELAARKRKMQSRQQAVKAKGLTDMSSYSDNREMHMLSGGLGSLQK